MLQAFTPVKTLAGTIESLSFEQQQTPLLGSPKQNSLVSYFQTKLLINVKRTGAGN
jgi:hypothetical protein